MSEKPHIYKPCFICDDGGPPGCRNCVCACCKISGVESGWKPVYYGLCYKCLILPGKEKQYTEYILYLRLGKS